MQVRGLADVSVGRSRPRAVRHRRRLRLAVPTVRPASKGAASMNEREPDLAALIAEREHTSPKPRHPCDVTADRIAENIIRYTNHLTAAEVWAMEAAIMALVQVGPREDAARKAGVSHA